MLDVLGWTPLSQRRQEARLILFYKIINGLAQVPFEGVLVEAYKGNTLEGSCGILNQNQDVYIFINFDFMCT